MRKGVQTMYSDEGLRRREVECLLESTLEPAPNSPEHQLGERYGVQVRYMDTQRAFSFPEYRVVVLPENSEQDARVYSLFHEMGHVEKGHPPKGDADPLTVLRWEAEAWRWARQEAQSLGYDIPGSVIRDGISSYVGEARQKAA